MEFLLILQGTRSGPNMLNCASLILPRKKSVEFEVPAEPTLGVFKRKWETDLELLRE